MTMTSTSFRTSALAVLVVLLGACADRKLEPEPTVEEVCDAVCIMYDRCWEPEDDNPYSSIPECVEDCNFLYHAWPYDPDQRYDCADAILDLQWCYASLGSCEEFDGVSGKPGNPCSEEFNDYSGKGCIGGPDPRDYVDTDT